MRKLIGDKVENGFSEGDGWVLEIEENVWENLTDSELIDIANQIRGGISSSYDPCGWSLVCEELQQLEETIMTYNIFELDTELIETNATKEQVEGAVQYVKTIDNYSSEDLVNVLKASGFETKFIETEPIDW